MMLTKGSFTNKTCRIFVFSQWLEYPSGKIPRPGLSIPGFCQFRIARHQSENVRNCSDALRY